MSAPDDLERAADWPLVAPVWDTDMLITEFRERYAARDIPNDFAEGFGRTVAVEKIPRDLLAEMFRQFEFEKKAAVPYACMTRKVIAGGTDTAVTPMSTQTSRNAYMRSTMGRSWRKTAEFLDEIRCEYTVEA